MEDKYFLYENKCWYFWDEVWANPIGPYDTREEAEEALVSYCEYLNKPKD